MNAVVVVHPVLALLLAPLLPGVINRTKALFAGRNGPPLLQAYYDLWKLFRKGAVYSRTTTWMFRAGPLVNFACLLAALALVPLGRVASVVSFTGDLVLLAYLLGLGRFATVAAALDTGSSFEGMGASREVQFAVFAEPALLLGLAALARHAGSLALSGMYAGLSVAGWGAALPMGLLLAAGLFILFLAENCRIPVDDPNTHLELTMIHEVMVLDHGGVDFGFVLWGAHLKLWVLGALLSDCFRRDRRGIRWRIWRSASREFWRWPSPRAWRNPAWRACGCCACPNCWWARPCCAPWDSC